MTPADGAGKVVLTVRNTFLDVMSVEEADRRAGAPRPRRAASEPAPGRPRPAGAAESAAAPREGAKSAARPAGAAEGAAAPRGEGAGAGPPRGPAAASDDPRERHALALRLCLAGVAGCTAVLHDDGVRSGAARTPAAAARPPERAAPPQPASAALAAEVGAARTPLRAKALPFAPPSAGDALRPAPGVEGVFPPLGCTTEQQSGTSLMMRNLPISFTRQDLLEVVGYYGFAGKYDFVYLPIDFKSGQNFGYAFLNMTSSEHAGRFKEAFDGFNGWPVCSRKVCEVCASDVQGLESCIELYQRSYVIARKVPDEWKPAVFRDGQQIPFPVAKTRRVRTRGRRGLAAGAGGSAS